MNAESGRNRREFFRLVFPVGEELAAWIDDAEYKVNEISERTIRFTAKEVPHLNGKCCGLLTWSDGRVISFEGLIGPLNRNQRVIIDVRGIVMPDIVAEQRRLLTRYPMLKDD